VLLLTECKQVIKKRKNPGKVPLRPEKVPRNLCLAKMSLSQTLGRLNRKTTAGKT
jgi:hypothetical protein